MKIAHITNRYPPAIGGVEEYVKSISDRLVNRNNEIYIFTSHLKKNDSREKLGTPCYFYKKNLEILRFFSFSFPGALVYPIFPTLPFILLRKNVDIIHAHGYWYYPADISGFISRIKRVPFVFNPYFYKRYSWKWDLYKKFLGEHTMRADVIIVISEWEEKLINNEGFNFRRMELIPPGINLEEFEHTEFNVFEKYKLIDRKVVLFVGRIAYIKGIDVLIKAAPHVLKKDPDTVFFIIGPDFGEKNKLELIIKDMNLEKNFIFAGELSRKEIISAYKNASIFVLPSRYEAFGIVLIEAMASKLPIVATDCSAIPYVIKDGKNGLLFSIDDSNELAEKIILLLENNRLKNEIIANGFKIVKEKYNWEKSVTKLEKIYLSLI